VLEGYVLTVYYTVIILLLSLRRRKEIGKEMGKKSVSG